MVEFFAHPQMFHGTADTSLHKKRSGSLCPQFQKSPKLTDNCGIE